MLVKAEEEGLGPYAPRFLRPKRQRECTEVCRFAGGLAAHRGKPETRNDHSQRL